MSAYRRVCASSLIVLAFAAVVAPAPPVAAQVLEPEGIRWRVAPDFADGRDARRNISGAACAPTSPALRACIAVNDEKKYAQFFAVDGSTIVPGRIIRLSREDAVGDPDAEGVAYDGGYFYITGSHGRSRGSDKPNEASYRLFRLKVDARTGLPEGAAKGADRVGVEATDRLRALIAATRPIASFQNQPLAKGGLNIEGIAVRNGRMFVGFRGPSIDRQAFVLSLEADALFTGGATRARMHALPLGKNTGIRDLAAVDDGVLVLSGPVREEKRPYAVWLWNERDNARLIGVIPRGLIPKNAKAETLLVLASDQRFWRVLVMFDGVDNGAPVSFRLPR
jgi:hypothetical protein